MLAELASPIDFEGFRQWARQALSRDLPPDALQWSVAGEIAPELFAGSVSAPPRVAEEQSRAESATRTDPGLFAEAGAMTEKDVHPGSAELRPTAKAGMPRVPAAFIDACRQVALHSEPQRFARMYKMLWRMVHEPLLRSDPLDPEWIALQRMAQAVRRDMHKMKAFVRFRSIARGAGEPTLHVAWFEPDHHIVEAVAPFFVRRFANMEWTILTPLRSVVWDGSQLCFGPGASKEQAPAADAGEALWLTYYRSIFNPARLKLQAMQKEMPRRYWQNLPEAELISELSAQAVQRSGSMIESPGTPSRIASHKREALRPRGDQRGVPDQGPLQERIPQVREEGVAARKQVWLSQRAAAANCRECPIGALATQTVWGEGPIDARLMLVGEQPGDQEDLQGVPFVGPSGNLLNRALAQLQWPRERLYVTNSVKHFKYEPRGKRRMHVSPAQREADACQHWLEDEIRLVGPQAIVALGATAARQLLGRPIAVTRERGQWHSRDDGIPVLVTLHPSALLRSAPSEREAAYEAWLNDLQQAARYVVP